MSGFLIVLPLIIIMALGNISKRKHFYSEQDIKSLTKTLFWIIMPALLYRATFVSGMEILKQPALLKGSQVTYVVTLLVVWVCGRYVFHRGNIRRLATSVLAANRGNNIYLGVPLVYLAMGEAGLCAASVYIAVTTIGYQIISIGGGDIALSEKLHWKCLLDVVKRLFHNPQILACIFGVMTALLVLDKLPKPLDEALKLLGNAASALALLMIGASIDFSNFKKLCRMFRNTWWDVLVRLGLHPMLMWLCLTYFDVPAMLLKVTVLISAMPTAVNVYVFSSEMGMDGEYGAELVAVTTILSAFSIPIWINVLGIG